MSKTSRLRTLSTLMLMAAITLPAAGCKKPDKNAKRTDGRTVKASIAEFNPDDVSIDLDKWGTARVDDWLVQEAFNRSFEGIDRCIVELKQRKRMSEDKTLGGNVEFAVKLNPSKERPFAVNATLSNGKLSKDEKFKGCLREAVAEAGYPTYDGPPQVAEFYVEPLDPGFEYE